MKELEGRDRESACDRAVVETVEKLIEVYKREFGGDSFQIGLLPVEWICSDLSRGYELAAPLCWGLF
jgi:hypothetical protein